MTIPDVVVYLSSLQKQTASRKIDTLMAFAAGAQSQGATVHVETKNIYTPSKLAVILGWASPLQQSPNIKLRAHVVQQQKQQGNHVMAIDANCFKFADPDSRYLRYSINGVYYDTSEYANGNSDASKWHQLSQDINVQLQDWRSTGNYILLLIQRDGGWSMKGADPVIWARKKIKLIRSQCDMPIVLRPHPGKIVDLSSLTNATVVVSDTVARSLQQDIDQAAAAVVFNSSSGVAAILHGVPLWVDDPGSVCWAVANKDIDQIQNPVFFDRNQWINDLAACHWTDEESRQGLVFQKFLPYIT